MIWFEIHLVCDTYFLRLYAAASSCDDGDAEFHVSGQGHGNGSDSVAAGVGVQPLSGDANRVRYPVGSFNLELELTPVA